MKHLIIILTAFLALSASCDKTENPDGGGGGGSISDANHFSCYVNGAYWEAKTDATWGGSLPLEGEYIESTGIFQLQGNRRITNENLDDFIIFDAVNILDTGVFDFYVSNELVTGFVDLKSNFPCSKGYFNKLNPGKLKISRLDKTKRIIGGTFEMTLRNPNCNADSLIHFTNGKFTFNY